MSMSPPPYQDSTCGDMLCTHDDLLHHRSRVCRWLKCCHRAWPHGHYTGANASRRRSLRNACSLACLGLLPNTPIRRTSCAWHHDRRKLATIKPEEGSFGTAGVQPGGQAPTVGAASPLSHRASPVYAALAS